MRVHECLLALSSVLMAVELVSGARGRLRRRGAEQDFWSGQSVGGYKPGDTVVDIPVNDVPLGPDRDRDLDRIQVISSAITVLPRKKGARRARRETVQSWRRPRHHQFVTNRLDRLAPPPIVHVYPPVDRSQGGRFYDRDRDLRKSKRRIIYYATLPEIVRPPVAWYGGQRGDFGAYDPRQAGGYPAPSTLSYAAAAPPSPPRYASPADNEITRVQSNIIDVTANRYTDGYASSPSLAPKFTIIDVEPPYNFPGYRDPPQSYDINPRFNYNANRYYGDVRTPPYRDQRFPDNSYYRPQPSLEPIKLNIPTTASERQPSAPSSTAAPSSSSAAPDASTATANSTRFLPDALPASLRALSLTRSRFA